MLEPEGVESLRSSWSAQIKFGQRGRNNFTAAYRAACYCLRVMKITYDPPPPPTGWLGRLIESAAAMLVGLLLVLLPRSRPTEE